MTNNIIFMKNSIKLIVLAVICAAAISCETKPSTMSYSLSGQFGYVAEYPKEFPTVDSLYYNKYVMLDEYSALVTNCEDVNSGYVGGGWKVSMKKGGTEDSMDLMMFTSAGKYAGLTDPKTNFTNKAYAVFNAPSMSTYDIVFKYQDYFTKSTCNVHGFYINNTKYVEKLADEGKIGEGDFLKVTAQFYKSDIQVCTEEFYLVDYTTAEHKVVRDWTAWVMDSAKSHDVDAIKFSISSKSGSLPQAFCLDYFVAAVSVEY